MKYIRIRNQLIFMLLGIHGQKKIVKSKHQVFTFLCLLFIPIVVSSNQILTSSPYDITFSPYKSKHLLCNNFISIVKFFFVKLEFYYTNERCASTTCIYLLLILIQQCTSNHKQHLYHDDEVFL